MSTPDLTVAARLIAKVLSHRQTPPDEVVGVIRNVHSALARLGGEPERVATGSVVAVTEHVQASPTPRRRRRQPEAVAPSEEVAPSAPVPPAAKLVRRADVLPAPASPMTIPSPAPVPSGTLRGVVKWFDPRAGKGALRLPGFSGDVVFDARILAESGIARLFKGQEVEATTSSANGRPPEILRIALPGSAAAPAGAGVVHSRRAKPVLVELKREALRRAAARAEAEHLLGPTRSR